MKKMKSRNLRASGTIAGERDIIESIVAVGRQYGAGQLNGDDCAILEPGTGQLAVSADALVEGVHFNMDYFTPWYVGRRAAAVNLSDMAGEGAVPAWAFLSIALPDRYRASGSFIEPFAHGLCSKLAEHGAVLAGGDTVSSPGRLCITLTLIGKISSGRVLRRDGASPGDFIYCSGPLGEAAAGLSLLSGATGKRPGAVPRGCRRRLCMKHLDPEPRIRYGTAVAGIASAGMDMSDGIATDLAHLCSLSGTGAVIHAGALPISRALRMACRKSGLRRKPLDLALFGGEDFELLWTAAPERHQQIRRDFTRAAGHPPFRIGTVTEGTGVILRGRGADADISFRGYEH